MGQDSMSAVGRLEDRQLPDAGAVATPAVDTQDTLASRKFET